jgi:hypothetical protein
VLREPNTWLLGGYAFLLFGTMTMMQGLWAVPYLMDIHGETQQEAANALTLWAVGLIVGCTTWGYVADHVVKTRKGAPCRRSHPAGGVSSRQPDCDAPCCLRAQNKRSASGIVFRGYPCVTHVTARPLAPILPMVRR